MSSLHERYPGTALVTGASSGIGAVFARRLAAEGFPLVLVARREERLAALARELDEAHGVSSLVLPVDLAAPGGPEQVARRVVDGGVELSLLVNNAGFGAHGPTSEIDPGRLAGMVDLNCRAPVLLTRLLLPGIVERGRGALVFLASTAAYLPTPWLAVYGATKAFNLLLAESLRVELRGTGVDVLALSPGVTRTEFSSVAGLGSGAPAFMSADPEQVVETALRALGRKGSVVHALPNKLLAALPRLLPRSAMAGLSGRTIRAQAERERQR